MKYVYLFLEENQISFQSYGLAKNYNQLRIFYVFMKIILKCKKKNYYSL